MKKAKIKKVLFCILPVVAVIIIVGLSLFIYNKYQWATHEVEPYQYDFIENNDIEIIRSRILEDQKDKDLDVTEFLNDLDENGKFKSIPYDSKDQDTWHPIDHLDRTYQMQVAYNSEGNKFYHNEELKTAITKAMRFWINADLKCEWNGWYNSVGVGMYIPDILLFGVDGLSEDEQAKLLENIKGTLLQSEKVRNGIKERKVDSTGGNLTDQVISTLKVAVVENDGNTIKWLGVLLERELSYFPSYNIKRMRSDCEGIKEDGSFQQHDQLIYFGGYGEVFADGINKFLEYTYNTQYQLIMASRNSYADFLLDSFSLATRNGYRELNSSGRNISRIDSMKGIAPQVKKGAEILIKYGDNERQDELQNLLDTRFSDNQIDTGANKHKYFYESDYQLMNNKNYMASVRSASNRTRIYEYLNGENPFAYYTGLGATFFYVNGDEYYNLLPGYDWNKVPGTTTRQGYVPYYSQDVSYSKYGTTNHVSGVSNGNVGMSYMELRNDGVTGKKSYFMFEDGVVCLGNSIKTSHKEPLLTCINQTNLKGDIIIGGDNKKTLGINESENGVFPYIYHNSISYITDDKVEVSTSHETADWKTINERFTQSVPIDVDKFTLSIPHDEKKNVDYAYTVLLNTTPNKTEEYLQNPYLMILRNDETCQAVYDSKNDVLEAVFHKKGSIELPNSTVITANKPCVMIVESESSDEERYVITVASYNGKEYDIKININDIVNDTRIRKKAFPLYITKK